MPDMQLLIVLFGASSDPVQDKSASTRMAEWAFLQPLINRESASLLLIQRDDLYGITKQCGLRMPIADFVSVETIADLPPKHILK